MIIFILLGSCRPPPRRPTSPTASEHRPESHRPRPDPAPPPPARARPRPAPPPFLPAITTRVAVATPRRPSRSRSSAPRRAVRRPAGPRHGGGRAGEAAPGRHRLRRALRREGRLPQLGTLRAGSHSGQDVRSLTLGLGPWRRARGFEFNIKLAATRGGTFLIRLVHLQ